MVTYAVFGLGMMGEAICFDLLSNNPDCIVHAVEISEDRIQTVNDKFEQFSTRFVPHQYSIDANEVDILMLLEDVDLAFGAIDYSYNLKITKWCIKTKTHFLDLGGNPNVVAQQYDLDNLAKDAEVSIIPDCGLAPGMVNVIASGLLRDFESVDECHLRVGGLPQKPKGILQYQQVFSIRGLTNEYIENAIVIRNGKIKEVPSLTELETICFPEPYGQLEAFQTAGGTSSLPRLYEGKVKELTYKTIRYAGHMQYFKFLVEFGLLSDDPVNDTSAREIVEQKLVEHLPKNEPDVVLARIFVSGKKDGDEKVVTMQLIDYQQDGYSAMARTTAFPISIIGQMIMSGDIEQRGVVPSELVVPFDKFMTELERRKIIFNRADEVLY